MTLTTKEVLVKAKDLLRQRGWVKGQYQSEYGCLCSLGAIWEGSYALAAGGYNYDPKATRHPAVVAEDLLGVTVAPAVPPGVDEEDHPIARWNDAPERTLDEVLAAFDAAIAAA